MFELKTVSHLIRFLHKSHVKIVVNTLQYFITKGAISSNI